MDNALKTEVDEMNILLAVDVQEEFRDQDGRYERIVSYIKRDGGRYDRVYATMCANSPDSPFVKNNVWLDCLDGVKPLAFSPDKTVVKYSYGCLDYQWLNKENHYDIIGFNTDCCVLKVALDLFDRGYDFRVLTEYCYSSDGASEHQRGVAVLRSLLGPMVL
jgi:nicotinamidase-related amidase